MVMRIRVPKRKVKCQAAPVAAHYHDGRRQIEFAGAERHQARLKLSCQFDTFSGSHTYQVFLDELYRVRIHRKFSGW